MATVTTTHVLGGTEGFFVDVQDCYERWVPATAPGMRLTPADRLPAALDEVDDSELFLPAVRRRFQQDVTYTTSTYLEVVDTYSARIHRSACVMAREPKDQMPSDLGR